MNIVIPFRKIQSDKEIVICVKLLKKWGATKIYVVGDEVPTEIKKEVINLIRDKTTLDYLDATDNILHYINIINKPFIMFMDDLFITDMSVKITNNFYYNTFEDKLKFVKKRNQHNQDYYKKFNKVPFDWKMYELHTPFIVKDLDLFVKSIHIARKLNTPALTRSVYGNILNDKQDKCYYETYGLIDAKYHKSKLDKYDCNEILKPFYSLQATDKLTPLKIIKEELL